MLTHSPVTIPHTNYSNRDITTKPRGRDAKAVADGRSLRAFAREGPGASDCARPWVERAGPLAKAASLGVPQRSVRGHRAKAELPSSKKAEGTGEKSASGPKAATSERSHERA